MDEHQQDKWERLRTLFKVFFKISAVTLGGGLAMLPLMSDEFVEKRKYLSEEEMVDIVAVVQSLPGIIAVNMGVLIGYRTAGIAGAMVAAVAVVLPPFVAILVMAGCFRSLYGSETVDHIFLGVRAAVCALILLAVIKLGKTMWSSWFNRVVAGCGFVALVFFNVNAIALVVAGGVAGIAAGLWNTWRLRHSEGRADR